MCLTEGYHGETIGALSVGALDLYAKIYEPMLMDTLHIPAPDCYRCPYGAQRDGCDCACLEHARAMFEQYGAETAALIVEPLLQGSAGMRIYPAAYLKGLRDLCDEFGVLLIADEIATGFGRTGKMFACNHAGISPDIMCLSKGLTGGYLPMALTVTTEAIYQAFYSDYNEGKAFMHSHTYSGNPLGCSAALAVQQVMREEHILEHAQARAPYLHNKLLEAFADHPHVGEVRQLGLINAVEIVKDRKTKTAYDSALRTGYAVYKEALKEGLLLRPLGDVLYFNPPLIINEAEIDEAVARMTRAFHKIISNHQ